MTNSGSVTGAHKGGNNLKPDMYDAFAEYLANVTLALKHGTADPSAAAHTTTATREASAWPPWGSALVSVTPLNEPVSSWWTFGNNQEGCHFDRDKQAEIITRLGQQLAAQPASQLTAAPTMPGVSGPEENSIDDALLSLTSYPARTLEHMDIITTHTYNGVLRSKLANFTAQHGKELWNSEYGTGSGPLQGGLQLAQRITLDLNQLAPSVWTLWQAADLDNALSPFGWGLLAATTHEENLYHIVASFQSSSPSSCCLEVLQPWNGGNVSCLPCDVNNRNQVCVCVCACVSEKGREKQK